MLHMSRRGSHHFFWSLSCRWKSSYPGLVWLSPLSKEDAATFSAIHILKYSSHHNLLLTAELLNRIILSIVFIFQSPILISEQIASAEQQHLLLLGQDVHLWLKHHLHKEVAGKHLKDLWNVFPLILEVCNLK